MRKKFVNPDQLSMFDNLDETKDFFHLWTFDEIIVVQKTMIIQALNELRDHRKSYKMRKEAWDWLFSDEDHPFSSETCAANSNIDIDKLRNLTRYLVKDIR